MGLVRFKKTGEVNKYQQDLIDANDDHWTDILLEKTARWKGLFDPVKVQKVRIVKLA